MLAPSLSLSLSLASRRSPRGHRAACDPKTALCAHPRRHCLAVRSRVAGNRPAGTRRRTARGRWCSRWASGLGWRRVGCPRGAGLQLQSLWVVPGAAVREHSCSHSCPRGAVVRNEAPASCSLQRGRSLGPASVLSWEAVRVPCRSLFFSLPTGARLRASSAAAQGWLLCCWCSQGFAGAGGRVGRCDHGDRSEVVRPPRGLSPSPLAPPAPPATPPGAVVRRGDEPGCHLDEMPRHGTVEQFLAQHSSWGNSSWDARQRRDVATSVPNIHRLRRQPCHPAATLICLPVRRTGEQQGLPRRQHTAHAT